MKGPFAGPKAVERDPAKWLRDWLQVVFRGGPEGTFIAKVDPSAPVWRRPVRVPVKYPDGSSLFDTKGEPAYDRTYQIDTYRREVYACNRRTRPDAIWHPMAKRWISFEYVFESRSPR